MGQVKSLVDIHEETARAHELHGRSFEDGTDGLRIAILVEEIGEVARAVLERNGLRAELVQVASLAIRWIDQLDAEGK